MRQPASRPADRAVATRHEAIPTPAASGTVATLATPATPVKALALEPVRGYRKAEHGPRGDVGGSSGERSAMAISVEMIKAGLKELGLATGDVVLVHSDLRRLGKPRELVKLSHCGADAVIDAFVETVGPEGVVIVPTLTRTTVKGGEEAPSGLVFDPAQTPSCVGSITNVMRLRPDSARSTHPTHSIVAIGGRAKEMCRVDPDMSTFDRRGPWGRMYDWDGSICWFGTLNKTNTTVHVVEDWMDLPYMETCCAWVRGPDGRAFKQKILKAPLGPRDFYRVTSKSSRLLDESGIIVSTLIGQAKVSLMKVRDVHRVIREGIIRDPCLLLKEPEADEWSRKACEAAIPYVREKFGRPEA